MSDESLIQRQLEQHNETARVLRAAKALIDTPEKWLRYGVRDGDRRCMLGALLDQPEHGEVWGQAQALLLDACVPKVFAQCLSNWNDAPERTHADVMDAFSRAIELAEKGNL